VYEQAGQVIGKELIADAKQLQHKYESQAQTPGS
jgi:hypothetical protein